MRLFIAIVAVYFLSSLHTDNFDLAIAVKNRDPDVVLMTFEAEIDTGVADAADSTSAANRSFSANEHD